MLSILPGRAVVAVALLAWFIFGNPAAAQPATPEVKLLFSGTEDALAPWGKLQFGATSMRKVRDCVSPGFVPALCLPGKDGRWEVYGQIYQGGSSGGWKLVRAVTRDGALFEDIETVFTAEPGRWTSHLGLAFSPESKEFLAIKFKMDKEGFAYRAFFSPDGRKWKEHPDTLFYDGDSLGLFWSPTAHRFICTSKTLQPVLKHIQDHGGTHVQLKNDDLRDRRVQTVRSSHDGRSWEPSTSMVGLFNPKRDYRSLPVELMIVPDADDPPDMEFYRSIGFWHYDRAYMVVLNYAASPLMRGKHGPQLDTEWWTSRDGLRWERPFRGLNALGELFSHSRSITHNPMIIDGMMLFHFGDQIWGVGQDRISYVSARANAEFTTRSFAMPQADLLLNAAVPSIDRAFAGNQAYVMAAALDDRGQVIPGFEAKKCLIRNTDQIVIPLQWGERSARELAGRKISLRLYLRGAAIYAVGSN